MRVGLSFLGVVLGFKKTVRSYTYIHCCNCSGCSPRQEVKHVASLQNKGCDPKSVKVR